MAHPGRHRDAEDLRPVSLLVFHTVLGSPPPHHRRLALPPVAFARSIRGPGWCRAEARCYGRVEPKARRAAFSEFRNDRADACSRLRVERQDQSQPLEGRVRHHWQSVEWTAVLWAVRQAIEDRDAAYPCGMARRPRQSLRFEHAATAQQGRASGAGGTIRLASRRGGQLPSHAGAARRWRP